MNSLLLLISFLPICVVCLTSEIFKASQTRIIRSAAFPNRVQVLSATHSIDIFAAQPLSQILIFAPSEISVGHIQLVNKQFQEVPITVSEMNAGLLINLNSPILFQASLTILLQRVRIFTKSRRVWNYELYAKYLNDQNFKIIGVTRITTYSDSSFQK